MKCQRSNASSMSLLVMDHHVTPVKRMPILEEKTKLNSTTVYAIKLLCHSLSLQPCQHFLLLDIFLKTYYALRLMQTNHTHIELNIVIEFKKLPKRNVIFFNMLTHLYHDLHNNHYSIITINKYFSNNL